MARDSVFVTELFIGIYSDCRKIISLIGYKADIEYRFPLRGFEKVTVSERNLVD